MHIGCLDNICMYVCMYNEDIIYYYVYMYVSYCNTGLKIQPTSIIHTIIMNSIHTCTELTRGL